MLHLCLVLVDRLDLLSTCTALVKGVSEPLLCQATGKLDADDPLTHAEHLSVVGEDSALNGEAVVCRDSANAGNLVGGDRDTEAWSQFSSSVESRCIELGRDHTRPWHKATHQFRRSTKHGQPLQTRPCGKRQPQCEGMQSSRLR